MGTVHLKFITITYVAYFLAGELQMDLIHSNKRMHKIVISVKLWTWVIKVLVNDQAVHPTDVNSRL